MSTRIFRFLGLALSTAVVLLLASVAILVITFDPNDYRSRIESTVSTLIDRDVRVSGNLEIAFSLIPTIVADGVTIANPPWASEPIMASAERLKAQIALKPLLERRVEIAGILLEGVNVELERDSNARGNWEFAGLTAPESTGASDAGFTTSVGSVELRDINVRYADATGVVRELAVERMVFEHPGPGAVALTADGQFEAIPIHIEWRAGPLDVRQDDNLRWPVVMEADIGGTLLTLSGRLRAPLAYAESDFELQIAGNDAGQFQALFDLPPSDRLSYELSGRTRISADSVVISDLRGMLANGRVFRELEVRSGGARIARGERVAFELAGNASGQPFSLAARAGTLHELIERSGTFPIDLDVSLGAASMHASGIVASQASGLGAEVTVTVNGDVIGSLNRLRQLGLPDIGPIELGAVLAVDSERAVASDLMLKLGDSEVMGTLGASYGGTKPDVTARITAPRLAIAGSSAAPERESRSTPWLDQSLPWEWLTMLDAQLELDVGNLTTSAVEAEELAIDATLLDGKLDISNFTGRLSGIDIAGQAQLGMVDEELVTSIELATSHIDATDLMRIFGMSRDGLSGSAETISLSLRTAGSTPRSMTRQAAIELRAEGAGLELTAGDSLIRTDLASLELRAEPGQPAELSTTGSWAVQQGGLRLHESFALGLQGATLKELLEPIEPAFALSFDLTTRYRDAPVELSGEIRDVLAAAQSMPTDFLATGSWGPWRTEASGALFPVADLVGTTIEFDLESDDLISAGRLLELEWFPGGAGSLSGQADFGTDGLSVSVKSIEAPGMAGAGNVALARDAGRPVQGSMNLSKLDIGPFLEQSGPAEQDSSSTRRFVLSQIYSPDPLDLEVLNQRELVLDISIDLLHARQFVSEDVSARIQLAGGELQTNLDLDGGRFHADLNVDARAGAVAVALDIAGDDIPLAADRSGQVPAGTPVIDMRINLTGQGNSTQALAESLDGNLLFYLRDGRLQQDGMRFLFGSVLFELIDAVNPFSQRQSYTEIQCVGAYFDVKDGVMATANGIVLQTPELQAIGVGSANLVTNELLLRVNTKRRQGIAPSIGGIVNEFVELSGTLDAPRIGIGGSRAARRGILAFATGGLSILATDLFGRITAGDACAVLPELVGAPGALQDSQ